ncbi:hypothetical protein JGH11_19825 [Dysgonomonas sp. Marseille-P4677]|nr:hypothetical protein [Dysgonomonas sp. Marseille-P4677]
MLSIILVLLTTVVFSQNQTINGNLHVSNASGGNLRIGKLNDIGNKLVPLGALAAQYNLDFSGYRDVAQDQIGARIAALRFNKHQENNALIQKTALAFYTNPSGINTGTADLIERMRITPEGNIGIGISFPTYKLEVAGVIRSKEVKIEATGWSDFVFAKYYRLPSLQSVEQHINNKGHLPDIPSEREVIENGINVGVMQAKLLQKIEELTLYVIDLKKKNEKLEKRVVELEKR